MTETNSPASPAPDSDADAAVGEEADADVEAPPCEDVVLWHYSPRGMVFGRDPITYRWANANQIARVVLTNDAYTDGADRFVAEAYWVVTAAAETPDTTTHIADAPTEEAAAAALYDWLQANEHGMPERVPDPDPEHVYDSLDVGDDVLVNDRARPLTVVAEHRDARELPRRGIDDSVRGFIVVEGGGNVYAIAKALTGTLGLFLESDRDQYRFKAVVESIDIMTASTSR